MTPLRWQKSTFSSGEAANCVEVASDREGIPLLRESDDPGTVLSTTPASFRGLLAGIKAGEFDGIPGTDGDGPAPREAKLGAGLAAADEVVSQLPPPTAAERAWVDGFMADGRSPATDH
ncbi:DUF397 domain-containing protein [Streptomyces zingiberis]|uniref:DUF397 domain-containing protein n=1 Tax=Streptomyces zingiberis TaxID=2053010 RepID=A0ABX1BVC1_9ACTN|nr:DUF397 domain-containing protein [Streptomyces zingiberis]NJQ01013.1 DUF397 domain-containing protein [Streptomyces zingiberis]